MKLFVAPLQGHTDAAFRHYHAEIYNGGADAYFSPFMRVERGAVRPRDIADVTSALNDNHRLVPQFIFRDAKEFEALMSVVDERGLKSVDLNLGCPFPPQVHHGRGSAMLQKPDVLREIHAIMSHYPNVVFSAKMRLGVDAPSQWRDVIDVINQMPLEFVTVHPRIASQQYGGSLYIDEFEQLYGVSAHPVVFNGDVRTPQDFDSVIQRFPELHGVMVGRGLLARPSLIEEYRSGCDWDSEQRINCLLELHEQIFEYYQGKLCGDTQILMKIKSFWEYLEPEIGHKAAKAIKKATSLNKYEAALASIG